MSQIAPLYYGIIPVRYGSSRLPGKPLIDIWGKPMFWYVYQNAVESNIFRSVVLATDSEEIAESARQLSIPYVMTSVDHISGTDRVCEAAIKMNIEPDSVVINIQGDEPLVKPEAIQQLVEPFIDVSIQVTTLATRITANQAMSPHQVKVVVSSNGDALYFSRAVIPYLRDSNTDGYYLGHIGLYAFRMHTLDTFVHLPPSQLEQFEKLEQLRLLENNIPVRVVNTSHTSQGVDTVEDLEIVQGLLAQRMEAVGR